MKFKYKKYGSGILRPVIPIKVRYKDRTVNYQVLIDSGADICIFDASVAALLGVKLDPSKKAIMVGITGKPELYYYHKVIIIVGEWEYVAEVGFKPNFSGMGYGVVGQKGFFDNFVVKFDLTKAEIDLNARLSN